MTPSQRRILEALAGGGGRIVAAFASPDIHVVSMAGVFPVDAADCLALEDAGLIAFRDFTETASVSTLTDRGRAALAGAGA